MRARKQACTITHTLTHTGSETCTNTSINTCKVLGLCEYSPFAMRNSFDSDIAYSSCLHFCLILCVSLVLPMCLLIIMRLIFIFSPFISKALGIIMINYLQMLLNFVFFFQVDFNVLTRSAVLVTSASKLIPSHLHLGSLVKTLLLQVNISKV